VHVESESKSDTSNNRGDWNHFKITQTLPEEIKELHKNSHIGDCTHTAEYVNVRVQNIFYGQNNLTCSTNCKYRTAATLHNLETWFVSGIIVNTLHNIDNKDDDDNDDDNDKTLTSSIVSMQQAE